MIGKRNRQKSFLYRRLPGNGKGKAHRFPCMFPCFRWGSILNLLLTFRYKGLQNRSHHGQETTRRSNPGREMRDRAEGNQERERFRNLPATWHFTIAALSVEGRSRAGSKGSA